ncbi:unnamed protein product [Linum trigynum]|uniref:Uncharacterized protein n=1 Tax=Linum trigynum TaxID=586398 RepID=A0AAV2CDW5_9ROSI
MESSAESCSTFSPTIGSATVVISVRSLQETRVFYTNRSSRSKGRRARVVAVRWGLRRQERDLQPTKLRRMDQNQNGKDFREQQV